MPNTCYVHEHALKHIPHLRNSSKNASIRTWHPVRCRDKSGNVHRGYRRHHPSSQGTSGFLDP